MTRFQIRDAEPDEEMVAADGKLVLVDLKRRPVTAAEVDGLKRLSGFPIRTHFREYLSKEPLKVEKSAAFEKFLKRNAKSRLFRRRIASEVQDA